MYICSILQCQDENCLSILTSCILSLKLIPRIFAKGSMGCIQKEIQHTFVTIKLNEITRQKHVCTRANHFIIES